MRLVVWSLAIVWGMTFLMGAAAAHTNWRTSSPVASTNTFTVLDETWDQFGHVDVVLEVWQTNADNDPDYDYYHITIAIMSKNDDVNFDDVYIELWVYQDNCGSPTFQDHELEDGEYNDEGVEEHEHVHPTIFAFDPNGNDVSDVSWAHDWKGIMDTDESSGSTWQSPTYWTYRTFDWNPLNTDWNEKWYASGITAKVGDDGTCSNLELVFSFSVKTSSIWGSWDDNDSGSYVLQDLN